MSSTAGNFSVYSLKPPLSRPSSRKPRFFCKTGTQNTRIPPMLPLPVPNAMHFQALPGKQRHRNNGRQIDCTAIPEQPPQVNRRSAQRRRRSSILIRKKPREADRSVKQSRSRLRLLQAAAAAVCTPLHGPPLAMRKGSRIRRSECAHKSNPNKKRRRMPHRHRLREMTAFKRHSPKHPLRETVSHSTACKYRRDTPVQLRQKAQREAIASHKDSAKVPPWFSALCPRFSPCLRPHPAAHQSPLCAYGAPVSRSMRFPRKLRRPRLFIKG